MGASAALAAALLRRAGMELCAERVNHVWSYAFVFDQTEGGRRLKWLPIGGEFSRELVALEVERRMEAKDVIRILDAAVLARGCVPEYLRSDNGPECVALAVQEWIARRLAHPPASLFPSSPSAGSGTRSSTAKPSRRCWRLKVLGPQHRHWHNQERPHSSLDDQTPAEFAQRSPAAASAPLRQPQGCALPTDQITPNPNPENQQKLS